MKTSTTKTLGLVSSLVLGLAGGAYAGEAFWNFDDATNPTNGFTIVGSHPSYYYPTNGNPATGGYLSIGDGGVGGQNLMVVFPDIDQGYPVKAFHLTMDLRVGNATGNGGRPADGFSISYCREGDPALINATNGTVGGAAGGDDAATTQSSNGSGDFENGTKTGVAICFDAWQGNMLPDTGAGGTPGPDVEGIEVRVDDHTLKQVDMQADRNGGCAGDSTSITGCSNNVCADPGTMQTGPYVSDSNGDPSVLCWQPLDIELNTNKQVTVIWKGHTIVDHFQLANYTSHRGRLVIMGRTGGANQNDHIDNIHLVTTPAVEATFGSLQLVGLDTLTFTIDDNGTSHVTGVPSVKLDGVDITAQVTITSANGVTTGTYKAPANFPSASSHSMDITWQTSLGQTLGIVGKTFSVMPWAYLDASLAVPASSIDQNQAGFTLQTWQSASGEPNRMYWADEQLMGLHGTNQIDTTGGSYVNGVVPWTDVLDFMNAGNPGQFGVNYDWVNIGIPGGDLTVCDNMAMAATTYLYFPAPGTYIMGGNSDDSLRVTVAQNANDLLGQRIPGLFADVGRGIGANQNTGAIVVTNAGYYGFRFLFENGGGGCAAEWYFYSTPASSTPTLINDLNGNPTTAIKAFQVSSAAPPYVSYAEPPLDDNQVRPDQALMYKITDTAAATVTSGSITLKVNGVAQSPTISSAGGVTTVSQPAPATLWPAGTNTVELAFKDSANNNHAYRYIFISGAYVTLDASMAVPLGSEDTSKPGFVLTVSQINFASVNDSGDTIPNQIDCANGMIAGAFFPWYGANVATVTTPTTWTGVVDFNSVTSVGNFTNDFPMPGIPGTSGSSEQFAALFQGWIAFPAAGYYQLGVNSDDCFRVGEGFAPRQVLHVAGTGINKDVGAVVSQTIDGNGGFGVPPPVTPIVAPVVYVDATNCPNIPDLTGKIAVADHNLCGKNDVALTYALQQAGALAAVIINDPTFGFPYTMTGTPPGPITIPALNVSGFAGERDFWRTNANLTATVQSGAALELGSADYGKGMSDVDFGILVPQAGVYPIHLIYDQGGGGAGVEFSQVRTGGTRVLVNDASNPNSLKVYRAVNAVTRPTLGLSKAGNAWQITFTGKLYSASSAAGPYTAVSGASSPYTVNTSSATQMYFRAGQ